MWWYFLWMWNTGTLRTTVRWHHSSVCELYVQSHRANAFGIGLLTRPRAMWQQTPTEPVLIPETYRRQEVRCYICKLIEDAQCCIIWDSNINRSALVHVMDFHQLGGKLLCRIIVIGITNPFKHSSLVAYIRIGAYVLPHIFACCLPRNRHYLNHCNLFSVVFYASNPIKI